MADQELNELIESAKQGDEDALAKLFSIYKSQLRKMISFRLDQKVKARVSASDILQEAYLDLAKRLSSFDKKKMSFFVWIRLVTQERILIAHRQHLDTKMRDAKREVSLDHGNSATSSLSLANHFAAKYTSVVGEAIKTERRAHLQAVLDSMSETDREIIGLRIFEGLTNREAAEVLGLNTQTSSSRFLRAMDRLRQELVDMPGIV